MIRSSTTTATIFRITSVIYIEPIIRIRKESFGWRIRYLIRIHSTRFIRRLSREIRVQNNARCLLWCKPRRGRLLEKHAARDGSIGRIFRPVHGAEEWGDRITIASVSIVRGTERVPCTLGGEGRIVWASENGPIAWRGLWKYRLGVNLHAWWSITTHPSDSWRWLIEKLGAGIALYRSWLLLTNGCQVLYETGSFGLMPVDFSRTTSWRSGAWPKNTLPLQNS